MISAPDAFLFYWSVPVFLVYAVFFKIFFRYFDPAWVNWRTSRIGWPLIKVIGVALFVHWIMSMAGAAWMMGAVRAVSGVTQQ